ncbi:MAG TPA: transcription elongation factor GreA [Alphaproteobacteria bacterium]|jgi:transcription elongation factor GreA|nr:transcription elongation factor GreA [Alphaproteobacteria bacterium]
MLNTLKLTKSGQKALQAELDVLVNDKRPKLVDRLSYARAQGDLAENSDYQSAKEELEFLDGRIDELTDVLKTATVVDDNSHGKSGVGVGTKVTVKVNNKEVVFNIVGEWEADPMAKKISHESPLGTALMGKKVGEKAEVEAPAGKVVYEVVAVE